MSPPLASPAPPAWISATTSSAALQAPSRKKSFTTTRAPAAPSATAIPRPIPRPPPVTTATRPSNPYIAAPYHFLCLIDRVRHAGSAVRSDGAQYCLRLTFAPCDRAPRAARDECHSTALQSRFHHDSGKIEDGPSRADA